MPKVVSLVKGLVPEPLKKIYRVGVSLVGSALYGFPTQGMTLIGVTGTSGKSSTCEMLYTILRQAGYKAGIISTVSAKYGEVSLDTGFHVTTPSPFTIQKLVAKMKRAGVTHIVLEISSHALDQNRLGLMTLKGAICTNITEDHLDWHKTWENYAIAKAKILDIIEEKGSIILNKDDPRSYDFLMSHAKNLTNHSVSIVPFSKSELSQTSYTAEGLSFVLKGTPFTIPVLGEYNVENALAAIRFAETLSIPLATSAIALATFMGIPGRMEVLQQKPFLVIVDFAHNTDSLEKSLKEARKLTAPQGRVITVFGSAGLRDKKKRTTMGIAAAELADIIVVTAEDPRTEKLFDINTKILAGAQTKGATLSVRVANATAYLQHKQQIVDTLQTVSPHSPVVIVFDEETVASRYNAVDCALATAKPGDVVILEGKGHEQSLCFGETEYPFTDQEAVKKSLAYIQ